MKNPDWNKKNEGERPDGGILKPGERIDELQRNNYRIIQDPGRFCFGMDAVLLSGFARVKEGERVLDLGTGTGIIPILLEAKTRASHLTGLEIQPDSADMAKRSVALNGLSDKIDIVQGDIREAAGIFPAASFDVITCNPPYITDGHGLTNPEAPMAIARHEVKCTFADVAAAAAKLLVPGAGLFSGASSLPAGRNHRDAFRPEAGAEADEAGIPLCGPGAEYGASGGEKGRKKPSERGKASGGVPGAGRIY